jgi:hypothetical protein
VIVLEATVFPKFLAVVVVDHHDVVSREGLDVLKELGELVARIG